VTLAVRKSPGEHHPALRRAAVLCAAVVALLVGLGAGVAQAHAVLESSTPAQGALSATSPTQVRLHFGEPVEISTGSLRVLDSNGKPVQDGAPTHPGGVGSDVAVPLKSLANGSYLVLWRVISADSHPVDGTFTFSVGHAGAVAAARAATTDRTVAGLLAASRGIGYLGIAVFLGGFWFVRLCWPEGAANRVSRRVTAAGWILAMLGAGASLLLQGPYGAGLGLSDTLDSQVISGVVDGRYGHAVLARLGLLVLAAGVAWWGLLTSSRTRLAAGIFSAVALGMLATFSWTGHSGVGIQVPLAVVSDLAHLTAMSVWLGGLVQLALAVLPTADEGVARRVAARFSTAALIAVAVLIVSGSYQAWRQAGILDSLTATNYGKLLLVKVALVLAVVVVAYFSRRWVRGRRTVVAAHLDVDDPGLQPSAGQETAGRRATSGLRLTVAIEAALLVVVLGVTSFLVSAPPAREAYRPSTAVNLQAGPVTVQVSIVPTGTRVLDLHFYTFAASGEVLPVQEMDVSMTLPAQKLGPITIPVSDIAGSHFLATGVQLPYAGVWTVGLKVRTTAIDEYDTTTKVRVR
jgi:copper transport protein